MLFRLFGKFRRPDHATVVAYLGLFVALGGTGAYAANTIGSADIIDGQVKSVDVGDAEILSADVKDQSLTTFDVSTFLGADVVDGTLTGADVGDESLTGFDIADGWIGQVDLADNAVNSAKVANFSLGNGDFIDGSVDSRVATDNSLTGADINESTLNLAPVSTTTFANASSVPLSTSLVKVASKVIPAGSWAVVATVTTDSGESDDDATTLTALCELRNGSGVIGATRDRRSIHDRQRVIRSMTVNGGAQVAAGGGEVSLWCSSQDGAEERADAQMMMTRVGGFS